MIPFLPVGLTGGPPIRTIALVDGEHYPPVVTAALEELEACGHEVVAAVLLGGREKLGSSMPDYGDVEVRAGDDPRALLDRSIVDLGPELIVDLSDEPVLDYRRRHELISIALFRGIPYAGADFRFEPPPRPELASTPTLAIIGTGKRTGKTAVAGFAARTFVRGGWHPVVVAMGRGGPATPEVLKGDEISLQPKDLLAFADQGKHAASDYIEDALLARVPTVGCRRCGGGLAGAVEFSNVAEGISVANGLGGDLMILEGSGSSIPPAHADATMLVVPASIPEEYLVGYLSLYRLLLSDFVVVTMCENPFGTPSRISSIASRIRDSFRAQGEGGPRGELQVIRTVFRPTPTRTVDGASVFVATTAPEGAGEAIKSHLEKEHGCRVVGISHSLSDRPRLEEELGAIKGSADVLLCEIKAAGIDVATRWALDSGVDVVYLDNSLVGIDGDDPTSFMSAAAEAAKQRYVRNQ